MFEGYFGHDPGLLGGVYRWIDNDFGPIKRVYPIRLLPPDPRWWVYACELARVPVGTWHSPHEFSSAGSSIDPNEALQRALGETIERYAGLSQLDEQLLRELSADLIPVLHSLPKCDVSEACPQSLKKRVYSVPLTCYPSRELISNEIVYVPAAYVGLSFEPTPAEPIVTFPISTGLAFNPDITIAKWRGICEIVERDAMMLMWWCRLPRPKIVCTGPLPEQLASRIDRLEAADIDARLYDISSDIRLPTVFCVLVSPHMPFTVVGAACHEDPCAACCKALDEAVSGRVATRMERWNAEVESYKEFDWVRRLEHHAALYAGWRSSPAFDYLSASPPITFDAFSTQQWVPRPRNTEELAETAIGLREFGLSILWTEITTPEAAQFGHVVKVVIPELVPLSPDHRIRWLATPRLRRKSQQVGVSEYNPFPHPFA